MGIRLKMPNIIFTMKKLLRRLTAPVTIIDVLVAGTSQSLPLLAVTTSKAKSIRMAIPAIIAMMKLQITPAADTQKFATRLSRQARGFTGVAFAHPSIGT
jgi:hypothetical protein